MTAKPATLADVIEALRGMGLLNETSEKANQYEPDRLGLTLVGTSLVLHSSKSIWPLTIVPGLLAEKDEAEAHK